MKPYLLVLYLISTSYCSAQKQFTPTTRLGIKQGFNLTSMNFTPQVDQKLLLGYNAGVTFIHISQPNLGIQMELNFSQKGWEENLENNDKYVKRLNCIEFPLLTYIELNKGKFSPVLNIGPFLSISLHDKETIRLSDPNNTKEYYEKESSSRLNIGLGGGGGFTYKTQKLSFLLQAQYLQSLSNTFNPSDSFFSTSQNQTINISLSILLNLK